MQTLLFNESPLISLCLVAGVLTRHRVVTPLSVVVLICFMLFYRYCDTHVDEDDVIVSPAEGLITHLEEKNDRITMCIYLDIFNNHTQVYPVDGIVVKRTYDDTGKFSLAVNREKSRHNEKKIHHIATKNGGVKITQIAGFFPRRIVSDETTPLRVSAGDYLGMIKFGSRVDLEFNGHIKDVLVKTGDKVRLGDVVYRFEVK